MKHDVIIVGGGPAGLDGLVTEVLRDSGHVVITDEHGSRALGRALLLATGLIDELPNIPGADRFYGRGLYTCIFCDGWEMRDRPLAVIATAERGVGLAKSLTVFSDEVVLVVQAGPPLTERQRAELERPNIEVVTSPVVAFEGSTTRDGEESLEALILENTTRIQCRGAFVGLRQRPASDLARRLGCDVSPEGRAPARAREAAQLGFPRVRSWRRGRRRRPAGRRRRRARGTGGAGDSSLPAGRRRRRPGASRLMSKFEIFFATEHITK